MFPEKRDFFLENSGVFQFGAGNFQGGGGGVGGGGVGRTNSVGDNILFFSRRIGLSDAGEAIPILGGTGLTGRAGGFTIGAMNIQQRRLDGTPAASVTGIRLRRNVLANSDIGVLVLNKDQAGPGYNRLAGADANFRFFRNLNINGLVANRCRRKRWWGQGAAICSRFNDELGFIPRTGVGRTDTYVGLHLRSDRYPKWLREFFPDYQIVNLTRADGGAFDSRYVDCHIPITLQNGVFIEAGVNASTEVLSQVFTINSRRQITIAPGRYDYHEYFIVWTGNRSAPLSITGRYGVGDFYDGYKHSYQLGPTLRLSSRLNTSLSWSRNLISLHSGAYTTDLITTRVNYSFSTRMFVNALLQSNTDADQWTSNVRFNIIHRPLSDLFLVYNDRRDRTSGALIDRAVIAKMTYMLAFKADFTT